MGENRPLSSRFADWLKKPYSEDMSVKGWFAFLGLLIILSYLWSRVLKLIASVAE
jgi:uncharacterized protein involved in cysteine biosynthesis